MSILILCAATALSPPPPRLSPTLMNPNSLALRRKGITQLTMAADNQQRPQTITKLGAAAALGLTAAALATDAPPKRLISAACGISAACVAPGLFDTHLAVSYGYGASLLFQSSLWLLQPTLAFTGGSRLLALSYMLYGLKVLCFQGLRDLDEAYVDRALMPMRKASPRGFQLKRMPLLLSIALLLTGFSFPLHAVAGTSLSAGVTLGAMLALGGLLLQSIADGQKYLHKREFGPKALMRFGLFAYSRHPNYFGEVLFHLGILLSGVSAALSKRSPSALLLSLLSPIAFIRIMGQATSRLEKSQFKEYGNNLEYREWVKRTPRLVVFSDRMDEWRRSLMRNRNRFDSVATDRLATAGTSAALAPTSEVGGGDTNREVIYEEEAQEERAEEIGNIVYVTWLAGVSTVVIGAACTFLLY